MIVDPQKQDQQLRQQQQQNRNPIEQDFMSMPYQSVVITPTHNSPDLNSPDLNPSPSTTYPCEKCSKFFEYVHSLDNHFEADHLTPNTKMKPYPTFEYFGRPKRKKAPKVVTGPIEEVIVDNEKLKSVFFNANSIVSDYKRSRTKLGIEEAKAHIVAIAETKLGKHHTEFKVPGYYTAANLIRKENAGGLVIMAKKNIQLHEINSKNILPEIQFVSFRFKDITFFAVYRSPSYGKTPAWEHHKSLIDHLDDEIDKLNGARYVLMGDFNISTLAKNNFEPQSGSKEQESDNNTTSKDTTTPRDSSNPRTKNPNTKHKNSFVAVPHTGETIGAVTKSKGEDGSDDDRAKPEPKVNRRTNKNKNKTRNRVTEGQCNMTIEQLWADFKSRRSLDQWVNEDTFHRYNSITQTNQKSMTDLVFTPHNVPIHQIKVDRELFQGRFDHFAIVFIIDLNFQTNETPGHRRLHSRENWVRFHELLNSYKLFDTAPRTSTDAMANYISDKIMEAYDEACPLVEVKPPPPGGHFHRETKKFIKKATRLRAKKRLLIPGSKAHKNVWFKLKLLEKCVDAMIRNDRVQNQIRLLERSKHDHTNFYAHIKKARTKTSTVGPVYDTNGTLRTSDSELSDSFCDHLGDQLRPTYSPHNKPINWTRRHKEGTLVTGYIDSLYVTPDMVKYHITQSKRGAAAGPDGIPMEAIAVAGEILVEPLAVLYNMINDTGVIPKCFRTARVRMLYKKGEKSDMNHYRPLSMSNHIGKIWERLVKDKLVNHLEVNNLLSKHQHGFRPFRGTTTNLLYLRELIMAKVDKERVPIELWNYDLSKAFDMLDHDKALNLLHKAGVRGKLGAAIQAWLKGRTQTVEVGLSKSEERPVGRSCCQGSVLGPILWLVYIQSLTTILDDMGVDYVAYADDLSIVQRITTDDDKKKFDEVLLVLQNWAKEYNMRWSPLKTQRMVFRYRNCPQPQPPYKITFGGKIIEPLDSTCLSLGVLFDKDLTFKSQIKKVCNQVRALTSLVRQEIANITPTILQKFYQVYIIPALIYCSQIWNPATETSLRDIERAVNSFWKLSKSGPPKDHIPPRLLLIILDLNYVKKLKDGSHVLEFDKIFETSKYKTEREDVEDKLPMIRKDLEVSRLTFSYRTRKYWNKLPKQIRDMTYTGFKTSAKDFVMNNAREFLNEGNKDKEVKHKIHESIPYSKSDAMDGPNKTNNRTNNELMKTLQDRYQMNFLTQPQAKGSGGGKMPRTDTNPT